MQPTWPAPVHVSRVLRSSWNEVSFLRVLEFPASELPAGRTSTAARPESAQRLDFNRKHSRKISDDGSPGVSGVGRSVYLPSSSAEIHAALVERVDRHRIAQHVDVAVALRQTLGERLPLVSAATAAVHA